MQQVLRAYLRKLTNLSGNNRSLLLSRIISDQCIDLHDFDYINNKPSFSIIDQLISRKDDIHLCDVLDSRNESVNKLSNRLKKLARMDKLILDERGARDLYVGWPFVQGKFKDGTLVRGPILFFPVTVERKETGWILQLRKDVNLTLNKTFLLAYAFYNQEKLQEDLIERVFDDFDKESQAFRTELYELFKEHKLEINFNRDNFEDKLEVFKSYKRADLENKENIGQLKLYPQAVLGIFPQSGSYLVPDYLKLIEEDKIETIDQLFSSPITENHEQGFRFINELREEKSYAPFEMDAYQENAIKAVKTGHSLVVQGPPGTGKSQLICNLIADFIARGKTVLMVCQKRAALNVVHERLKTKSVEKFVGLVHDFKNDRKRIYDQINHQTEKLDEYQARNNSLNTVHLERQFLQISRKIDQIVEQLEEFKKALFDEQDCGKPIKELYLTSDPNERSINLRQETNFLNFKNMDEFRRKLERYLELAERFSKEGYPLQNRISFAKFGVSDYQNIRNVIEDIPAVDIDIKSRVKDATGQHIDFETAEKIIDKQSMLLNLIQALKNEDAFRYFQHMVTQDQKIDPLGLANIERIILQCFNDSGPETSIKTEDLGRFQEALQRSIDASRNPWSWIKWRLFSKEKVLIKVVLKNNELSYNKQGINILLEKVDNRLNLEHNITKIYQRKWLIEFPRSYRKIDYQNWFYYQKLALVERNKLFSIRTLKEYFPIRTLTYDQFSQRLTNFLSILESIPEKLGDWRKYLSKSQINDLVKNPERVEIYQKRLRKDFDALCEYDLIWESLLEYEKSTVNKLLELIFPLDQKAALKVFDNSIRLAWIDHIENRYPILRAISSGQLKSLEKELREAVDEKMSISNDVLLIKARERTYRNLEYNRLKNLVTYRDLKHQVSKKRRIWPLRKLLANFSEETFDLIPCWLVSPESASAIFPMEANVFDLVVFDEASQCFSENGIPSIYRGKQVMVTGDDKQLRPHDLYKVRWEDENEQEIPELDIDSLLDLAKHYLYEVSLNGHYRSQSLALIDFSNRHFYKGRLKLLPNFDTVNSDEPALEYVKVEGVWTDNSNKVEAQKVARIAIQYCTEHPDKQVGIVTFNATQQMLVYETLDELSNLEQTHFHNLIVKNIENIQGDEKDIIIFSIGYAPNENGRMNINFGSLSTEGGENRLNVAITRAREKVIVVTSILPEELRVENTKNEGPKLLRKYLEYVKSVSDRTYSPQLIPSSRYQIDWYLSEKVKKLNSKETSFSREIPYADLTVLENHKYRKLILTDDERYHDAISAKDAHVYVKNILRNKHWTYTDVYSREFWIDRQEVNDRLSAFMRTENEAIQ